MDLKTCAEKLDEIQTLTEKIGKDRVARRFRQIAGYLEGVIQEELNRLPKQ